MEGGKITLEILDSKFPYMGFETAVEFLEWWLSANEPKYGQMYIKQDDGNYFVVTMTPDVARKLLEERNNED